MYTKVIRLVLKIVHVLHTLTIIGTPIYVNKGFLFQFVPFGKLIGEVDKPFSCYLG